MVIEANLTYYQQLNETVRQCADTEITIEKIYGQRYIGCGSSGKYFTLHGTPGNGLGQYLDGSTIEVYGNCQEACGDTMNDGDILIHGNCGDACGYGIRDGRNRIQGHVGLLGCLTMESTEN